MTTGFPARAISALINNTNSRSLFPLPLHRERTTQFLHSLFIVSTHGACYGPQCVPQKCRLTFNIHRLRQYTALIPVIFFSQQSTVHAAAPALPDAAQPSPVFYIDLKEGRRIDCNILVRAHNVVYHAPEDGCVSHFLYVVDSYNRPLFSSRPFVIPIISSFARRSDGGSDSNDDDDGDDDGDDDDGSGSSGGSDDESDGEAGHGSHASASMSASTIAALPPHIAGAAAAAFHAVQQQQQEEAAGRSKKRKRPSRKSKSSNRESDYDEDDGFIDNDGMSVRANRFTFPYVLVFTLLNSHCSHHCHAFFVGRFRTRSTNSAAMWTAINETRRALIRAARPR